MLKTFSIGGVHPHENKLSAHQPIIKAEIPAKALSCWDSTSVLLPSLSLPKVML